MGPRDSFVTQLTMPLMGQFKLLGEMLPSCSGPLRGLRLPLTVYYAGPRDGLIRQYTMSLMGQCEQIAQIFLSPAEYCAGPRGSFVR